METRNPINCLPVAQVAPEYVESSKKIVPESPEEDGCAVVCTCCMCITYFIGLMFQ
jgi:hypothetical protein